VAEVPFFKVGEWFLNAEDAEAGLRKGEGK
jgi:hypothetical protein